MPPAWSVSIDDEEYHPVPERWFDVGVDDGSGYPRLYAGSA